MRPDTEREQELGNALEDAIALLKVANAHLAAVHENTDDDLASDCYVRRAIADFLEQVGAIRP